MGRERQEVARYLARDAMNTIARGDGL